MCLILHGYSHVIKNLNPLDPVRLRGTVEPSSGPSVLVVCTEAINHSFLLRGDCSLRLLPTETPTQISKTCLSVHLYKLTALFIYIL